jgi:hypothetical protein
MTSTTLFGPLYGAARVDRTLDDAAWIRALLEVEVALSRAAAGQRTSRSTSTSWARPPSRAGTR